MPSPPRLRRPGSKPTRIHFGSIVALAGLLPFQVGCLGLVSDSEDIAVKSPSAPGVVGDQTAYASSQEEARGSCGDGEVDPGESCDDGDADEGDGCTTECEPSQFPGVCVMFAVAPTTTSVGSAIALDVFPNASSQSFTWRASAGTLENPRARSTTFRCDAHGEFALVLDVDDCPDFHETLVHCR